MNNFLGKLTDVSKRNWYICWSSIPTSDQELQATMDDVSGSRKGYTGMDGGSFGLGGLVSKGSE